MPPATISSVRAARPPSTRSPARTGPSSGRSAARMARPPSPWGPVSTSPTSTTRASATKNATTTILTLFDNAADAFHTQSAPSSAGLLIAIDHPGKELAAICDEGGCPSATDYSSQPTVAGVRHPEASATATVKSAGPSSSSVAAGRSLGKRSVRGAAALGWARMLI